MFYFEGVNETTTIGVWVERQETVTTRTTLKHKECTNTADLASWEANYVRIILTKDCTFDVIAFKLYLVIKP